MITSALKTVSATGLGLTMALIPPVEVEPRVLIVGKPGPVASGYFKLGANKDPAGRQISVNSRHLILDGKPWFPVIGELHFSRHPQSEWRESLIKMRDGGIRVVSTYVFWNHHEE